MRRRDFITLLGGGAAVAWPLAARAQQAAMPVIGHLAASSQGASANNDSAFRKGLSEMGFAEGRNVTIEARYANNLNDRLPALAAELVGKRVRAIYAAGGNLVASVAKGATSTIPIVFSTGGDPVEAGLVESFNRPGGNVTGVSFVNTALTGKRLGLLHQLVPSASRLAMLVNPLNPSAVAPQVADAHAAAAATGLQIEVFSASTSNEIDPAFARMADWRAQALLIGTGPLFGARIAQLATLASRYALPAIGQQREYTGVGGLMSYGSSVADASRLAGIYVGRILKGERPGDLPVMQPTKFELVINLTTARAIGLDVPPTLLAIADEVIE
jgi:putative ABC transport system substrate-binding protein